MEKIGGKGGTKTREKLRKGGERKRQKEEKNKEKEKQKGDMKKRGEGGTKREKLRKK